MKCRRKTAFGTRRDPWRNNMAKKEIPWTKHLGRLMVLGITLMITMVAPNIVVRSANMYQYTLDASQVLNTAGVAVEEMDVINALADFMKHKSGAVSLVSKAKYMPEDVFSKSAKQLMDNFQRIADIELILGIVGFLIVLVCFFFLIRWRKKKEHMQYLRYSVIAVIAASFLVVCTKAIGPLYRYTWARMIPENIKKDDFIMGIINENFMRQSGIITFIVVLVLLALLAYITWEIAGNKRVFKDTY